MNEKIKDTPLLDSLLRVVGYTDIPEFVNAVGKVLNMGGLEIVEEDNEVHIRTDKDLFEKLKEFKFRRTANVSVFKTARGSVYLFATKRPSAEDGVSVRFEISEDGEYYIMRQPSLKSIFDSRHIPSRIPRIGYTIKETFGGSNHHISSEITDIDED